MKIKFNSTSFKVIFWVIIILGLLLRLYYMLSPQTILSTDETVYGVQAFNILHGERSVFYYNQNYTGTLSAFISAIFFWGFGVHTLLVKLPLFLVSILYLFAEYYLAKIIFDDKPKALLVLLLSAVTAPFWMNWTTRTGSGYPETILLGTLIFILVLKNLFEKRSLNFQRGSFFLIGLLGGLGYWVQPTIIYYLLPASLFIFFWKPKVFFSSLFLLGFVGFVIGSLPVILFNFDHQNLNTHSLFHKPFGVKKAAVDFFLVGLPIIFGLRKTFSTVDFSPILTIITYVIYLAAFLMLVYRRGLAVTQTFSLGIIGSRPKLGFSFYKLERIDIILVFLLAVFGVFSLSSPFNQFVSEPRYISPLYTALPILVVYLVGLIAKKNNLVAGVTFFIILGVQVIGLVKLPPTSFLDQIDLKQTIRYLESKNIKYVDTDADYSYRLILETSGKIIGATRDSPPIEARYPEYRRLVNNAPLNEKAILFRHQQELARCEIDINTQAGPCVEKKLDNGLYVYTWR